MTDDGRRTADGGRKYRPPFVVCRLPVTFAFLLLLFAFFLSACASTRPAVKIGLLAPFEGVYRQEGYDALAAMRAAIAEQNPHGIDVLPLALDTSRDVARTAQKVLADPSVAVVIGPYWAAEEGEVGLIAAGKGWLRPFAPVENGNWAGSVVTTAEAFAKNGGRELILAGLPAGWPTTKTAIATDPGAVDAGQAILWLGDAAAGADFALAVWKRLPDTPIGLYSAGAETFRKRVGAQMTGPVFLVGWIDADYPAWAENHSPNTPAAYTVYRLTADALRDLSGETITTVWQPALFILQTGGALVLSPRR